MCWPELFPQSTGKGSFALTCNMAVGGFTWRTYYDDYELQLNKIVNEIKVEGFDDLLTINWSPLQSPMVGGPSRRSMKSRRS